MRRQHLAPTGLRQQRWWEEKETWSDRFVCQWCDVYPFTRARGILRSVLLLTTLEGSPRLMNHCVRVYMGSGLSTVLL